MRTRYEYKTVKIPTNSPGVFNSDLPDVDKFLNTEAAAGWRLIQVMMADPSMFGDPNKLVAIMERPKDVL